MVQEFLDYYNDKVGDGQFTVYDCSEELLVAFADYRNRFIPVYEQEPPNGVEVLAKSPLGALYLTSWRPVYNIFTCQGKSESSFDWTWKIV